jgi:hypothetical protein
MSKNIKNLIKTASDGSFPTLDEQRREMELQPKAPVVAKSQPRIERVLCIKSFDKTGDIYKFLASCIAMWDCPIRAWQAEYRKTHYHVFLPNFTLFNIV